MRTICRDDEGRLQVLAGCHIADAVRDSIQEAARNNALERFDFNEVEIRVADDSDPALILRDFHRSMDGCATGPIGPYPEPQLSPDVLAHDEQVRAERDRRCAERAQAYKAEAETETKTEALRAKLEGIVFEEADPEYWQRMVVANRDAYGAAVITYARNWACLMQQEMAAGKALAEIAEATSHEADTDGITGFMYGAAVSTLAKAWKHGEELRRWHNLDTQLGTEGERANAEGGTLNPALLTLGVKG